MNNLHSCGDGFLIAIKNNSISFQSHPCVCYFFYDLFNLVIDVLKQPFNAVFLTLEVYSILSLPWNNLFRLIHPLFFYVCDCNILNIIWFYRNRGLTGMAICSIPLLIFKIMFFLNIFQLDEQPNYDGGWLVLIFTNSNKAVDSSIAFTPLVSSYSCHSHLSIVSLILSNMQLHIEYSFD